jgi:membrane protein
MVWTMTDAGPTQADDLPGPDEPPPRGRTADHPFDITWRGWRDVLRRVAREVSEDRLEIIAAGVGFYALLALGPAVAALVAIYGLVAEPADLEVLIASIIELTPGASHALLLDEMLRPAIEAASRSLTLGAVFGIMLSLWSANRGMKALILAIGVAYEKRAKKRGFFQHTALSFGLMAGAVILLAVVAVIVVALPHLIGTTLLGEQIGRVLALLRWPLLFLLFAFSLSVLYRLAPVRRSPKWRWVSIGSVVATLLWLCFSGLFSLYSRHFLELRGGYGAITGVIALALWLFGTAFVILLGAELNAEVEHQTTRDSTVGEPDRPLGLRGAYVADDVGDVRRAKSTPRRSTRSR